MSINLRLVSLLFTNNGSTNVNLKTIANNYGGLYTNNISMYLMFKLLGDNNISLVSNTPNTTLYNGNDGLDITFRIKHSNDSKAGLFFKNLFKIEGTVYNNNFIRAITITSNDVTIADLSYTGIDTYISIQGLQSSPILGATLYVYILVYLDNDFVSFAGLSTDVLSYTQQLVFNNNQQQS